MLTPILDRVEGALANFRPRNQKEFVVLQIARRFNDAGNFEARPFPADANGDRPVRHATFFAPGAPRTVSVGLKYTF